MSGDEDSAEAEVPPEEARPKKKRKKTGGVKMWQDSDFCEKLVRINGDTSKLIEEFPGECNNNIRQKLKEKITKGMIVISAGMCCHVGNDKKQKIVLTDDATVEAKIKEFHEANGAHVRDMRRDISAMYYAPNSSINSLCTKVVKNCQHCQTHQKITAKKKPLRPIRSARCMERVQIDLIDVSKGRDVMQRGHGYRYVLTVIDCFSKRAWVRKLKHKSAKEVGRNQFCAKP